MGYKLILRKKNGSESTHYYDDFDSLEWDAVTCAYSANIITIIAKENFPFGKTLFIWA